MTVGDKVVEVARDQVVEAAIAWTHAYEDGTAEELSQAMLELRRAVKLLLVLDREAEEAVEPGLCAESTLEDTSEYEFGASGLQDGTWRS